MTNPDFSTCTETRGGNKIVFGPVKQPSGTWFYVVETEQGFISCVQKPTDDPHANQSWHDLIPPAQYEWANVYRKEKLIRRWRESKSVCDALVDVCEDRIGYYRREVGKPETIEFVPLEGEGDE